ncbi:MAG: hypothetical protein RLZZ38_1344 [Bacteroidota bacterium]|jgi:antibiotic biosynthesis monooxygenase (ABM) superfamily enzyme
MLHKLLKHLYFLQSLLYLKMNPKQAPKWKLMILTWLFIYPLINVLFFLLFPLMKEWHQLLKTLTLTLILVPLMGAFLPKWRGLFKNWLQK